MNLSQVQVGWVNQRTQSWAYLPLLHLIFHSLPQHYLGMPLAILQYHWPTGSNFITDIDSLHECYERLNLVIRVQRIYKLLENRSVYIGARTQEILLGDFTNFIPHTFHTKQHVLNVLLSSPQQQDPIVFPHNADEYLNRIGNIAIKATLAIAHFRAQFTTNTAFEKINLYQGIMAEHLLVQHN